MINQLEKDNFILEKNPGLICLDVEIEMEIPGKINIVHISNLKTIIHTNGKIRVVQELEI